MPGTFRAAVTAEMGQAFSLPYLPVAALVGIRWPYHPLQLRYRWDHRVPLRRMIVRWLILAVVPYALVPALCLLMTVPAFGDRRIPGGPDAGLTAGPAAAPRPPWAAGGRDRVVVSP